MSHCWKKMNQQSWWSMGRVGRSKIEEHQNFRKVWRDHEACSSSLHLHWILHILNWLAASPWGVKKAGSVWVEHDAGGETSQTAARDVTFRQAKTCFGWNEKGFGLHNMMHAPQASCQLASTLLFWKDFKVFFCVCALLLQTVSQI